MCLSQRKKKQAYFIVMRKYKQKNISKVLHDENCSMEMVNCLPLSCDKWQALLRVIHSLAKHVIEEKTYGAKIDIDMTNT
jgi:hypothetical protein